MKLLKKCVFCDCDAWFLSKNNFIEKIAICAVEDGMAGFFCGGGRKWGFLWISSIWIKRGRLKQSKWCFLQAVLLRPVQFELKWCPQSFAWPSFFLVVRNTAQPDSAAVFSVKRQNVKSSIVQASLGCADLVTVFLTSKAYRAFLPMDQRGTSGKHFFFTVAPLCYGFNGL